MFKKNEQTTVQFPLLDRDTGFGITTGTVSVTVYHEDAIHSVDTIIPGTNHFGDGFWFYDMITTAMNADSIGIGITHANAVPRMINIRTVGSDMDDVYTDTQALVAGVTVANAGSSSITDVTDFHVSTAGLSTFDAATDFVTFATPGVDILSVTGTSVTDVTDFHVSTGGITATVSGTIDSNIIQVDGVTVADITDFHVSTAGLSSFDHETDYVGITNNAITSLSLASSAVNEILDSLWASNVDSSVTYEQLMEMMLAWMAGKTTVTDNGSDRTLSFYRRDGATVSFSITASETDSEEGARSTGGTIV